MAAARATAMETDEDGVGAEVRLVVRAVELDHGAIDRAWSVASMPMTASAISSLTLDDGAGHALAEVAVLVAVAELDGLELAGGRAAGHGGAAGRAVLQDDFRLERGVAARVEDLTGMYAGDDGHVVLWFRAGRVQQ
jgi:hypothetical protein